MSESAPSWPEPDPVIEAYKKDVDRGLLRENLKLTPAQRLEKLEQFMEFIDAARSAALARRKAARAAR